MRKAGFFIILIILFLSSVSTFAKERNIYAGDLIKLSISGEDVSEGEIREWFKEFEIVELRKKKDEYSVVLRTFETGIKTIETNNKKIVIEVKSALEEIKRDGIFMGDMNTLKSRTGVAFQYIFYLICFAFIISGVFLLIKRIGKKRLPVQSNFEKCINKIKSLSTGDDEYFVKLTFYLKEYIEKSFLCTIRGKTTTEIMAEINNIEGLKPCLESIRSWLTECDYYKFTKKKADTETKEEFANKLTGLIETIERMEEEQNDNATG
jgi:hypothetical protein